MDFSFVIKLIRTICCLHPFICFVFSDSFVIKQEPPTKLTVFNISFCIFHFLLNNIFCIYAAIINVFFNLKKKCIYTCTWNIKITLLHWFHISSVCTVHACTTFATTTCMKTYSSSRLYIRSYLSTTYSINSVSVSFVRCTDEEFFRYEGTHCTERVMTWELAVIICASAFGAFILVLLFIIIVMCCRNASNSADV